MDRINLKVDFRKNSDVPEGITFFGSVSRPKLRHFCILARHRFPPVPLRFFLLLVFVLEGRTRGGTVTSHYVGIVRKKRKERPSGRKRWWLIFVQTRLQTVWRERFRTIFKVANRKKSASCAKSRAKMTRVSAVMSYNFGAPVDADRFF